MCEKSSVAHFSHKNLNCHLVSVLPLLNHALLDVRVALVFALEMVNLFNDTFN